MGAEGWPAECHQTPSSFGGVSTQSVAVRCRHAPEDSIEERALRITTILSRPTKLYLFTTLETRSEQGKRHISEVCLADDACQHQSRVVGRGIPQLAV
jgi:hypothetical protein